MNKRVRVFGEVLFDQFPDGLRLLGGAPFNVAWHLQAFGQSPDFISRIGNDVEGRDIQQAMQHWGMSIENLQVDSLHPTGSVQITVVDNEPQYDILANQAYDFINIDQLNAQLCPNDVFYHGSLALRQPVSAAALNKLLRQHTGKIFVDVNLRSPWWQAELLATLLNRADWAKLNEQELMQLQSVQLPLKQAMRHFRRKYNVAILIVTRGAQGAVAINQDDEFFEITPPEQVAVVDTVGAGDAFSAVALLGMQHNWSLPVILHRAQAFASAIVGIRGATARNLSFYQAYTYAWQHAHMVED